MRRRMKPTRATESEQLRRGHQHDPFEIRHLKTIQHSEFAIVRVFDHTGIHELKGGDATTSRQLKIPDAE